MGKKYLETKKDSLESSILGLWQKAVEVTETNKNDKSDDGEGLDAVQPKAVKKKFKDRKDKDIDNDGDTDDSDEFLHKKRKAISKAMAKEEVELKEKPADFIRLSFRSPADVKKAKKWMDQNLPGANQGFTGMDASGKDIEFEDVDDAEGLMAKLKKAGFKFKMDHREALSAKQKKLDVDKDGEIEGSDLAKLRAKKGKKASAEDYKSWLEAVLEVRGLKKKVDEEEDDQPKKSKTETGKQPDKVEINPDVEEDKKKK